MGLRVFKNIFTEPEKSWRFLREVQYSLYRAENLKMASKWYHTTKMRRKTVSIILKKKKKNREEY